METKNVLDNNQVKGHYEIDLKKIASQYEKLIKSSTELQTLRESSEEVTRKINGLEVKKGSKYIIPNFVRYDEAEKAIYIGEITEGIDYEQLILKELILSTIPKNENKVGINLGIASLVSTCSLGGNNSENPIYFDEEVAVTLLSDIVGFEPLINYAFKGKTDMFAVLNNLGMTDKDIKNLLDKINRNATMRRATGPSALDEIQKDLIDAFFKREDLTKEEIENFGMNLCTNNGYFNHTAYRRLDTVRTHFDERSNLIELKEDFSLAM